MIFDLSEYNFASFLFLLGFYIGPIIAIFVYIYRKAIAPDNKKFAIGGLMLIIFHLFTLYLKLNLTSNSLPLFLFVSIFSIPVYATALFLNSWLIIQVFRIKQNKWIYSLTVIQGIIGAATLMIFYRNFPNFTGFRIIAYSLIIISPFVYFSLLADHKWLKNDVDKNKKERLKSKNN